VSAPASISASRRLGERVQLPRTVDDPRGSEAALAERERRLGVAAAATRREPRLVRAQCFPTGRGVDRREQPVQAHDREGLTACPEAREVVERSRDLRAQDAPGHRQLQRLAAAHAELLQRAARGVQQHRRAIGLLAEPAHGHRSLPDGRREPVEAARPLEVGRPRGRAADRLASGGGREVLDRLEAGGVDEVVQDRPLLERDAARDQQARLVERSRGLAGRRQQRPEDDAPGRRRGRAVQAHVVALQG
jgi:hypothetical protein